jgi:hypothetical protein
MEAQQLICPSTHLHDVSLPYPMTHDIIASWWLPVPSPHPSETIKMVAMVTVTVTVTVTVMVTLYP